MSLQYGVPTRETRPILEQQAQPKEIVFSRMSRSNWSAELQFGFLRVLNFASATYCYLGRRKASATACIIFITYAWVSSGCEEATHPDPRNLEDPCSPSSSIYTEPVTSFPFYLYRDGKPDESDYESAPVGGPPGLTFETAYEDTSAIGGRCTMISLPEPTTSDSYEYHWIARGSWGYQPGFNLSNATTVSFWVRGAEGGERIHVYMGGVRIKYPPYLDSVNPAVELRSGLWLAPEWERVSIDIPAHLKLCQMISALHIQILTAENSQGATVFLDEVAFE